MSKTYKNYTEVLEKGSYRDIERYIDSLPEVVNSGTGPLVQALVSGREDTIRIIKKLASKGGDMNIQFDYGSFRETYTPLLWAVKHDPDLIPGLVEAGADLEARGNEDRQTPLHSAAMDNNEKAMRLLVEAGADVNARSKIGERPLDMSVTVWANDEMEKLLLAHGADPNLPGMFGDKLLSHVVRGRCPDTLDRLLAHGADPHYRDRRGRSFMHVIAEAGSQTADTMIRRLQAAGVNINTRDDDGRTALHEAVDRRSRLLGGPETNAALLSAGADPDIPDRWGCTARLLAALAGRPRALTALADWQAAQGATDALGTAIIENREALARTLEHEQFFSGTTRRLLLSGVPVETLRPAVLCAYVRGSPLYVKVNADERREALGALLEAGLDLLSAYNASDADTLLHALCRHAPAQDIGILIGAAGAEAVNRRNAEGDTPLHCYLKQHRKPTLAGVSKFIEGGADTALTDGQGNDAVGIAAARAGIAAGVLESLRTDSDDDAVSAPLDDHGDHPGVHVLP